jgi:hypothetical protein
MGEQMFMMKSDGFDEEMYVARCFTISELV